MASRDHKPLALERSRSQRGSLSCDELKEVQRARILLAMVELASERGYIGAAVAPLLTRAEVSRQTFYEFFDGREDCFLAAFEWAAKQARAAVIDAYDPRRSWREQIRHALAGLLAFLDAEPELARICVIEALLSGKLVLERRAQMLDELIETLESSALKTNVGGPPLLTAEGIVGAAFSVIRGRLLESAPRPLIELHGQLMGLIALPYLGPRVAGEELTRAAPHVAIHNDMPRDAMSERSREPFDIRLTYRSVR